MRHTRAGNSWPRVQQPSPVSIPKAGEPLVESAAHNREVLLLASREVAGKRVRMMMSLMWSAARLCSASRSISRWPRGLGRFRGVPFVLSRISFAVILFAALHSPAHCALAFRELLASMPAAPPAVDGQETAAQELTVVLGAGTASSTILSSQSAAPPPVASGLDVRQRRRAVGGFPIERHPELSDDQLVVVGLDANGSNVSWSLARDPRVVRAEVSGPNGVLTGRKLYRGSADLVVVLPDLAQIVRGVVYQPAWNGTDWQLTPIGSFAVGGSR